MAIATSPSTSSPAASGQGAADQQGGNPGRRWATAFTRRLDAAERRTGRRRSS